MEINRYRYKSSVLVLLIIFFALCGSTYYFFWEAFNVVGEVSYRRRFTLSEGEARMFYFGVGALCIASTLAIVTMLYQSLFVKRYIILFDSHFQAPKNVISLKTQDINYDDIQSLSIRKLGSKDILEVKHVNGKLSISEAVLSDSRKLTELVKEITSLASKNG